MIRAEAVRPAVVIGIVAAFVALSLLIAFSVPLAAPLTDLFQEGEYLSPRLLSGSKELALLVHGLIDLWPSEMAAWACGDDGLILCTRASNAALAAVASVLFAACAFAMRDRRSSGLLAAGGAILILLLIDGRSASPIDLQQGSPSVRDILLLAELLCLSARPGRMAELLLAAAGVLAAVGLFWAYNRGLIGIVALMGFLSASFVLGRRRGALIGGAAFALTFALILVAFPEAARQHLANIAYWARHGDIWAYPDPIGRALANAGFYALAGLILGASGIAAWRQRTTGGLPLTLALLIVAAMVLQQIERRDDWVHLMFAVPWLFLLAVRALGLLVRAGPIRAIGAGSLALACGIGAVMIVPLAGGLAVNARAIRSGRPYDGAIVPDATREASAMLRRAPGGCTYVLDNGLALYALAGKPPCSRVIAPVYAQGDAETRLVADLDRTRPPMILGLSQTWFSTIDDRPLASRTPRLARWIEARYALRSRVDGRDVLILRR